MLYARDVLCAAIGVAAFGAAASGLTNPIPETIQQGSIRVGLDTVASGLAAPNFLTNAGDGTDRLFILEQTGKVRLVKNGGLQVGAFLDISGRLPSLSFVDERGLIGMAFHPDYATPGADGFGKIYTHTSEPNSGAADFDDGAAGSNHQGVIAEWQVDAQNPDAIDTNTRRELMRIDQPQANHNGGMIAFGPDDNLYIALGDGGGADDEGTGHSAQGNGQDMTKVLGKVLRIDPFGSNSANGNYGVPDNPFVNDANVVDEIFFSGTRNPFRFSFETDAGGNLTNHIIIADVGQNDIEEVNRVDVTTQDGANFGWRIKEGTFLFDPNTSDVTADSPGVPANLTDPIVQYDGNDEGNAVIGGFVYRGSAIPQLQGMYVFGDYEQPGTSHGRLFYTDLDAADPEILELQLEGDHVSNGDLNLRLRGLGVDEQGEIYAVATPGFDTFDTQGVALRLMPVILLGDANNDGQVTGADLIAVQQNFGSTGPADGTLLGDANDDGQVTGADLISVQQNFGNVLAPAPGSAPGSVPEPATLGLLISAAALGALKRRR